MSDIVIPAINLPSSWFAQTEFAFGNCRSETELGKAIKTWLEKHWAEQNFVSRNEQTTEPSWTTIITDNDQFNCECHRTGNHWHNTRFRVSLTNLGKSWEWSADELTTALPKLDQELAAAIRAGVGKELAYWLTPSIKPEDAEEICNTYSALFDEIEQFNTAGQIQPRDDKALWDDCLTGNLRRFIRVVPIPNADYLNIPLVQITAQFKAGIYEVTHWLSQGAESKTLKFNQHTKLLAAMTDLRKLARETITCADTLRRGMITGGLNAHDYFHFKGQGAITRKLVGDHVETTLKFELGATKIPEDLETIALLKWLDVEHGLQEVAAVQPELKTIFNAARKVIIALHPKHRIAADAVIEKKNLGGTLQITLSWVDPVEARK